MQEQDVVKLLDLLEAEYPQSFKGMDDVKRALKTELWLKEFADDNSKLVYAATRLLMRDGRDFAPTSGQIREKMQTLLETDAVDEQQAWALVSKACSNGSYGYAEEFKKLPPAVQKAVGRPEQLKEWAAMDADVVQSVVASNFMRSYRATAAKEKELARIPQGVKNLISDLSGNFKMLGENV